MERGYVKLWRKTLDSGIISNGPAWQLFGYLLLNATYKQCRKIVNGVLFELKPGDVFFSRRETAQTLKLGEQQIRTALKLLETSQIITLRPTRKGTIISFVNWDRYNSQQPTDNPQANPQTNPRLTHTQPTEPLASSLNNKNVRIKNLNTKSIKACAEPQAASAQPSETAKSQPETVLPESKNPDPVAITFPVTGDPENREYKVFQSDVDKWRGLYPALDIMQQLRNMLGWLDANPTRRKTRKGIPRFIANWLAKEQNRTAGQARASPAAQPKTFAELEEEQRQKRRQEAMEYDRRKQAQEAS